MIRQLPFSEFTLFALFESVKIFSLIQRILSNILIQIPTTIRTPIVIVS